MPTSQKILIVEDDPLHQELYIDFLPGDSQLMFCDTAAQATGLARLIKPALVFVDLGLPDGDGVRVVGQLRESIGGPPPAILVVTGDTDKARHQAALDAGAQVVITKPISEELLGEAIARLN